MSQVTSETPNVEERGAKLVELLQQQRDCYRNLKELSDRQRRLITDEDPEALLKLLAERQRLVDQLTQLNKALQPFRQEWASTYTQMTADRRGHVQEVLDDINTLLGSILLIDAEDSRLLSARKETVRSELQRTAAGRTVNAAYAAQAGQSRPQAADHEA